MRVPRGNAPGGSASVCRQVNSCRVAKVVMVAVVVRDTSSIGSNQTTNTSVDPDHHFFLRRSFAARPFSVFFYQTIKIACRLCVYHIFLAVLFVQAWTLVFATVRSRLHRPPYAQWQLVVCFLTHAQLGTTPTKLMLLRPRVWNPGARKRPLRISFTYLREVTQRRNT